MIAKEVLGLVGQHKVFAVYGELGAGKTTFIKAVGKVIGVNDPMSSPTFSIANEYATKSGGRFLHFDFYRIESERDAVDVGLEEYFESGDYCFIEWPEKIPSLLPESYVKIQIVVQPDNKRTLEVTIHG